VTSLPPTRPENPTNRTRVFRELHGRELLDEGTYGFTGAAGEGRNHAAIAFGSL
jgi:hypothetical protein